MNPHKSELKILYWNANSIHKKIHEIYAFLLQHSIDIACISETFLKTTSKLNQHPEFVIYRHDRDDDQEKGGVLMILNRRITHQQLPHTQCNLIENINIEVSTSRTKIIFSSCYLPGGSKAQQIRNFLKDDITKITRRRTRFYAMGDFNAKHRFWGCNRANLAGTTIYNEFCNRDFDILFPHEHSHHPFDPNRASSTLDICLTNSDYPASDLATHNLGSDHLGVTFTISLDSDVTFSAESKRPCFRKADWNLYQSAINRSLIDMDFDTEKIESTAQIDELIEKFTAMIHEAKSQSVPLVGQSKHALELTPEIIAKIQERSVLERRYQRCKVFCRKIFYKWQINGLRKEISHEIDGLRNSNWSNYLESIPTDDNYQKLWKTSKFLKNRNRLIPPLRTASRKAVTPQEKADVLAKQFAKAHANPLANERPEFTQEIEAECNAYCAQIIDPKDVDIPSTSEIEGYVKRLKNGKAPGLDQVNNTLLKHLPKNGFLFLHLIIACCFKLCYFPEKWKHANVIGIHKPGKKTDDPSSYRPISLLSSISKILERAMLTRLNFHLSENNIIPDDQCGFVHGKSTTHQLSRIKTFIQDKLHQKSSTGMLLIDVEKAFDRVWFAGLIKKMIDYGFPPYLILLVNSFLHGRTFAVSIDGKTSTTHEIPFGTPQGAVCSPTLYNIYTSDAPHPHPCERALFADDTCFFTSSLYKKDITSGLRTTMRNYLEYFEKWKVNLNLNKSQAIFFTRRRTKEIPLRPLRIDRWSVRWATEPVKYLGFLLDKTMTLRPHVDYATNKANLAVKVLYPLINRRSKLNTNNKLLLYKVAIRPVMTYGAPVLNCCAATHLQRIQTTQNKILRMIYDAPYNTPITTLHQMANIETIQEFLDKLTTNFDKRLEAS